MAMTSESWRDLYWYHSVDLGDGVVAEGDYDMAPYLPAFHFPDDMTGWRVLDIGRASGFFSFEFEERGADVTATELGSFFDWDFIGGERGAQQFRDLMARTHSGDVNAYTQTHITGAFHFAHASRRSNVKALTANVYDIGPDFPGAPFDLVFCGSVLSHLRDPGRALANLYSVTAPNGLCIVSAPAIEFGDSPLPLMSLVAADPERRSWWVMNQRCLTELLCAAGFATASIVATFELTLRRSDLPHLHLAGVARSLRHAVAHARP